MAAIPDDSDDGDSRPSSRAVELLEHPKEDNWDIVLQVWKGCNAVLLCCDVGLPVV